MKHIHYEKISIFVMMLLLIGTGFLPILQGNENSLSNALLRSDFSSLTESSALKKNTLRTTIKEIASFSGPWTDNPAENTAITTMNGEQALPKIAVDSNGFAYVCWFSVESGYKVRLQRLDPNGVTQWAENGIIVSEEPQDTWITDYDMAIDPDGYALIVFSDIRTGFLKPVAYRISPDGEMMWGSTGILLADDSNFDPSPKTCATEQGNAVFAWQSIPDIGDSQVRLQKISPNGDLLWGDGIILSQSGVDYTAPYLLPAEDDYVYLIWHKETGSYPSPNRGLYVQKLDVDGSFMWGTDVEVYAPAASGPVVYLEMCRDDAGGIIFAWYRSDSITHFHSYVQRMAADGTITMPANGVVASTSTARNHMYPAPAFLSTTQEIILFFSEQDLDQIMRGMYTQKFDLLGNRLWGNEGKQLIGLGYNDYGLFMADGFGNQALCIYQAAEFGTMDAKIQAVMFDAGGNYVWPEEFIDLSTVQSSKLHNVMTTYYMGQWVAVWEDQRNDGGDIYAQNIQPNGTLGVVTSEAGVDVSQPLFNRGFPIRHTVDGDWGGGQNFTPTVDTLTKVNLYLRKMGTPEFDLTVELREDGIQGTLLDTVVIPAVNVSTSWTWLTIDFADITVGAGSDVFIVLPPAPSGVTTSYGYEWGYALGNHYDGGSFWFTRNGGVLWRDLPTMYEFCFKTYYE